MTEISKGDRRAAQREESLKRVPSGVDSEDTDRVARSIAKNGRRQQGRVDKTTRAGAKERKVLVQKINTATNKWARNHPGDPIPPWRRGG